MKDNKIIGLHHIAMKCYKEDYQKVIDFYTKTLGLEVKRIWGPNDIPDGFMIDLGNAVLEINTDKKQEFGQGVMVHYAIAVTDVDTLINKIKADGYKVFMEPLEIEIPSNPPLPARIAFCYGPMGEEIELFLEH